VVDWKLGKFVTSQISKQPIRKIWRSVSKEKEESLETLGVSQLPEAKLLLSQLLV
jgi:hypothetical protein